MLPNIEISSQQPQTQFNPMPIYQDLVVAQYGTPSVKFDCVNSDQSLFNLTGKNVRFVAYLVTGNTITPTFEYDAVPVTDNTVLVQFLFADVQVAEVLQYNLWDTTDNLLLAKGKLEIQPAVQVAPPG